MTENWRIVNVEEAVGLRIAHDITMVTESTKGPILRKGEIVRGDHVEVLKRAGHYLVAVIVEEGKGSEVVWEDEAVLKLAEKACRKGCSVRLMGEGKAYIVASRDGLLKIDHRRLLELNSSGDFLLITRKDGSWVHADDVIAVAELIPLYVNRGRMAEVLEGITEPLMEVKEALGLVAGLVVTGTEVYEGRVQDLAGPKVKRKLEAYGCKLGGKTVVPDDEERIAEGVRKAAAEHDLVIVTGGMSVDPSDVTPKAIAAAGADVLIYGIPVKPTTMSLLAYIDGKPVIGVSSGIIFFGRENVLDVLLPVICVGDGWAKEDIVGLGDGGLMDGFLEFAERKVKAAPSR